MIRRYSEMIKFPTIEERFEYVKLGGAVGVETFGWDRYLNQQFYRSKEWKEFRNSMIIRDNGCDLALDGYEIQSNLFLHHLNPITVEDILHNSEVLLDPENVVCVSRRMHQAIHYGDEDMIPKPLVERKPGDTIPWR